MRTLILLPLLLLTNCSATPVPTVDMTGVDPGRYSRDLAWCQQNPPMAAFGNPLNGCLERKGYKVLVRGWVRRDGGDRRCQSRISLMRATSALVT